jgi:hypothetical protein
LLLLLERAFLYARPGFDPLFFRVGPRSAAPPTPPLKRPSPPAPTTYTAGYYWREAWRTLRHEGLGALWSKTRAELRRREWPQRLRPLPPRRLSSDQVEIPSTAFSLLVAGSDVARFYPAMLAKRRRVQAARRRPDKEIMRLFHIPYQPNFPGSDYMQIQRKLVALFQLDQLFGPVE